VIEIAQRLKEYGVNMNYGNKVFTRSTPLVPSAPAVGCLSDSKSQNKLLKEKIGERSRTKTPKPKPTIINSCQ